MKILKYIILSLFLINIAYAQSSGCSDSDGGFNIYKAGQVSYKNEQTNKFATASDSCISNKNLKEYSCSSDFTLEEKNVECEKYCSNGACNKEAQKTTSNSEFVIAIYENGPASDVLLAAEIGKTLTAKKYNLPLGYTKLFSELDPEDKEEQVIVAIYDNDAVIIYGSQIDAQKKAMGTIAQQVLNANKVKQDTILAENINTLYDLFNIEKEIKEEILNETFNETKNDSIIEIKEEQINTTQVNETSNETKIIIQNNEIIEEPNESFFKRIKNWFTNLF